MNPIKCQSSSSSNVLENKQNEKIKQLEEENQKLIETINKIELENQNEIENYQEIIEEKNEVIKNLAKELEQAKQNKIKVLKF